MLRGSPVALLVSLVALAGCGPKPAPTVAEPAPPAEVTPAKAEPSPAAGKDQQARKEARQRLLKVALAIHEFEAAHGSLPAGTGGLSWRVQLLPYLGEQELYGRFNRTEAWDSPTNKPLVEKMPPVFASAGKPAPPGQTYLRSFAGESAIIPAPPLPAKGPPPRRPPGEVVPGRSVLIPDGTSCTLAVAEAAEPVEWTRPDDLPFPGHPTGNPPPAVPKLGGPFPDGFHGLMANGRVLFFPAGTSDDLLRKLISATGGEVIGGPEWEKIEYPNGRPAKPKPAAEVPDSYPDAAARRTAVANLRAINEATHAFAGVYGHLPAGVVGGGTGTGTWLSWRVQLLPYLGEEALYKRFKLNEPWDGPTNKPLVAAMPKVFASPGTPAGDGQTFLRATTGRVGLIPPLPLTKGVSPFRPGQPFPGRKFTDILDGTANTAFVVEAAEAVPWTKPDELAVAGDALSATAGKKDAVTVPKLGGAFAGGFHAGLGDGSVAFVSADTPAREVLMLLTPAGAEPFFPNEAAGKVLYLIPPAGPKDAPPGRVETKIKVK